MDPGISRQLVDKMYEKRKAAALDLEKLVRDCHNDQKKIAQIIDQLVDMFNSPGNPLHVKNGGLIGLAGTAIALGMDVAPYMDKFIEPLLACFHDPENRIRYFSAECLYNIAKVSKGEILVYFNPIFDALSKLSADSELSVKNGAELLDRLLKDIVAESASVYVPQYAETEKTRLQADYSNNKGILVPLPEDDFGTPRKAFSLAHFIPLLRERILVLNPFTRSFLVSWISVLDSVPELELISYLPEFLDGLLNYLSDPTDEVVRIATENLLADFLREIREIAMVQRYSEERARLGREKQTDDTPRRPEGKKEKLPPITMTHNDSSAFLPDGDDFAPSVDEFIIEKEAAADIEHREAGVYLPGQNVKVQHAEIVGILLQRLDGGEYDVNQMSTALRWVAEFLGIAQDVMLPFMPWLIRAIIPNLAHHVPAIQQDAIRANRALIAVVQGLPNPTGTSQQAQSNADKVSVSSGRNGAASATASPVASRQATLAKDSSEGLAESTAAVSSVSQATERSSSARQRAGTVTAPETSNPQVPVVADADSSSTNQASRSQSPSSTAASVTAIVNGTQPSTPSVPTTIIPTQAQGQTQSPTQTVAESFDYQETVRALTPQLVPEHEESQVAALKWLIMLHEKVPRKILTMDNETFPALLKVLSDSKSEEVIRHDLQLLAQISSSSDESYFKSFMMNLLELFSTDRVLLDERGSLIIRQLCLNLSTERIFRTLAELLEKERWEKENDLEFVSLMVQKLNLILITSPELAEFRRRLKNLESRSDGQIIFTTLYRSWCNNAISVLSLCLLSQAYEHASNLLSIFADLEITVSLLVQVDKLVQLIESPVFTYLRLQLLEPEKYPYLFKCLYGLLMLLPQSTAFISLRNRLNAVNSAGFLQIAPRSSSAAYNARSKIVREEIKWADLLSHFRSVQMKHEKARRQVLGMAEDSNFLLSGDGDNMGQSERSAANGAAGRQGVRRRVTGGTCDFRNVESPSSTASSNTGSSARGILSPLNPRARGAGGLLAFTQQRDSNGPSRSRSPPTGAVGRGAGAQKRPLNLGPKS